MMEIGFLGGTGVEARGLALRFGAAGASIVLGSRSRERAARAAEECNRLLGRQAIRGGDNLDMLQTAGLVFLTVPFSLAHTVIDSCRSHLGSHHILVDVTVPMVFPGGHASYVERESVSNAEIIARHLPEGIPLVAAFKTIPAALLASLATPLNCDVFVCGDYEEAKRVVMSAISLIPSLRPLDAGPLQTARTLERMAVLAAELNIRHGRRGARFRVEGI